jgi:hypothetical protein
VAVTYDGTNVRVYLNGTLQDTTASSRTVPNGTAAMAIGDYPPGGGAAFNGRIDEVAVYTSALTQTRIQAHYNAGKP